MKTVLVVGIVLALASAAVPAATWGQEETPRPSLRGDLGPVRQVAERGTEVVVQVIRGEEDTPAGATGGRRLIGTGVHLGQGRILTCASVVGPAQEVLVVPPEGDTLVASVAGVDRRSNLALVEASGLVLETPPVTRDAFVFPGELVVAVGLGAPGTPPATFGTVVVPQGPTLEYSDVEMIQTTAPLFRGYTGGALLGVKGRLLGIVSGVVERLEKEEPVVAPGTDVLAGVLYEGQIMTITPSAVSVALPIGRALEIAADLEEKGYVERGYLGLQVELTARMRSGAHLASRGVLVHRVVEGGPAARAGLLPGDRILEFGGVRVDSPGDLSFLVAARRPGAVVQVRYLRRGHIGFATVRVDQAPPLPWDPGLDATLAARGAASRVPLRPLAR